MLRMELCALLQRGLEEMNQPMSSQMISHLVRYLELIGRYNDIFKLSSVRNLNAMVARHLLDSLSVKPYIKSDFILDVGTGAGLPGIPLAIAMPDCQFTLLDNNRKKTNFLRKAVDLLHLSNVKVVYQSISDYQPFSLHNGLVCRAYSTIPELIQSLRPILLPHAQLLIMKGVYPAIELALINPPFYLINAYPIKIPFLSLERHIIEMAFLPDINDERK